MVFTVLSPFSECIIFSTSSKQYTALSCIPQAQNTTSARLVLLPGAPRLASRLASCEVRGVEAACARRDRYGAEDVSSEGGCGFCCAWTRRGARRDTRGVADLTSAESGAARTPDRRPRRDTRARVPSGDPHPARHRTHSLHRNIVIDLRKMFTFSRKPL